MKTWKQILGCSLGLLFSVCQLTAKPATTRRCSETGDIKGTVRDQFGKPVAVAAVMIVGTSMGALSDDEGAFTIHGVSPGTYDVKASFLGMTDVIKVGVAVSPDQTAYLDFKLSPANGIIIVVTETYIKPLVDKNYSTITNIPAELAQKLEHGNINNMITSLCSSCSESGDHQLVMRGSRPGTVEYIVDGEKMYGTTQTPSQAIEQVTVLSGGIPAEYGDFTGGVVIISTKNFFTGRYYSRTMRKEILENQSKEKAD